MSLTKFGTPDVCPECGSPMSGGSSKGSSITRKCAKCSYKTKVAVDKAEPFNGSSTVATPETDEKDSK